jgi:hypothetical protein
MVRPRTPSYAVDMVAVLVVIYAVFAAWFLLAVTGWLN